MIDLERLCALLLVRPGAHFTHCAFVINPEFSCSCRAWEMRELAERLLLELTVPDPGTTAATIVELIDRFTAQKAKSASLMAERQRGGA